jgi:hypothetical protein
MILKTFILSVTIAAALSVITSDALAWGSSRSSSASGNYGGSVSHSSSSSGGNGSSERRPATSVAKKEAH